MNRPDFDDACADRDLGVAEVTITEAFDAIGTLINGVETAAALMLARDHIHPRNRT